MTEAEFESQQTHVSQLQDRLDVRARLWRQLSIGSTGLALVFVMAAAGFIVAPLWLDAKS